MVLGWVPGARGGGKLADLGEGVMMFLRGILHAGK